MIEKFKENVLLSTGRDFPISTLGVFIFLFFCNESDVLLFSLFVHRLEKCRNGNSNDYGSSRKFQINPFVILHRFFQPVQISSARFYITSTFLNPRFLSSLISLTFSTKILSVEDFSCFSKRTTCSPHTFDIIPIYIYKNLKTVHEVHFHKLFLFQLFHPHYKLI